MHTKSNKKDYEDFPCQHKRRREDDYDTVPFGNKISRVVLTEFRNRRYPQKNEIVHPISVFSTAE